MEIGTKIKKVRELKNYTQEYMAQRLNVSQSTYSRYEKEDNDITVALLNEISEIFGMKIEDLLSFDEKVVFNNYASNQANQAYIINVISEKEREMYEKTIKLLEDKIKYLEGK
jgi:transcriptional regulator with XRE-family HTH domain